jgi:hypothetical protein
LANVDKFLFYITCTTCQARLKVRDVNAIGAILSCPKCESMVQVAPPPGWTPDQAEPAAEKPSPTVAADSPSVTIRLPAVLTGAKSPPSPPAPPAPPPVPPRGSPPGDAPEGSVPSTVHRPPATLRGDPGVPRCAAPPVVAAAACPAPSAVDASDAEFLEAAGACVATPISTQRWLLASAAAVLLLLTLVAGWRLAHRRGPVAPVAIARLTSEPAAKEDPPTVTVKPEPLPGPLDPRWNPDGMRLLLHLQPARFAALPEGAPFPPLIAALWRAFGMKPQGVRRLSWASTDLSDWSNSSVVVVELEPPQDAGPLRQLGQATDLVVANVACRRQATGPWTHPFAVLDAHTLITGREELLRRLSQRREPAELRPAMGRLIQAIAHDPPCAVAVDLAAARAAGWQLPTNWFDVWPAGRAPWHVVCETPEVIGLSIEPASPMVGEVLLACESANAGEKVRAAFETFLPEARKALAARSATLAAPDAYALLLRETQAMLALARPQQSAELVRVKTAWNRGFADLLHAALESRGAMLADWRSAATAGDEANQRQLVSGLNGYQKAERHFPEAAAGAGVLAAETRLSWIATLLPYYGHDDWFRRLEFGYGWNSSQNRPVAQQPLAAVVNPALGPAADDAGFPVTHYVGVAGLGADAGDLKPSDPRAGLFGNGRAARPEEMDRGAGNTIAILGVSQQLGAWAAGGHATVRGLTKAPYVNGPDGFGSGQRDGMFAGMADGSVHFIRKDVDARVFEQLVALHGGAGVTATALDLRHPDVPASPRGTSSSKPDSPPQKPAEPAIAAALPGPPPSGKPAEPAIAAELPAPPPSGKTAEADEAADNRPEIDVEERLATIIPKAVFHDMPLAVCLSTIGDLSGLAVTLDLDAARRHGLKLSEPISIQLEQSTVRQILEALAAKLGLAVALENNQVLLTAPHDEREILRTARYSVGDLARGPAVAALAELVRTLVAPDAWKQSGGRGAIQATGEALLVEQTAAVHDEVVAFCERLRLARQLPLRSQSDPARFSLVTRLAQAGPLLGRAVMINFHEPAPLARVLAALEEACGAKLPANWVALGQAHVSPEVKAAVSLQQPQPLAVVLDVLLRPHGLSYLAVDDGLIEITTRKAVAGRFELEFYPTRDLLSGGRSGAALVERVEGLAKATWQTAGGQGVARLDEPSGHLLVLQTQPVQGAIERLLTELRAVRKPVEAHPK